MRRGFAPEPLLRWEGLRTQIASEDADAKREAGPEETKSACGPHVPHEMNAQGMPRLK